MDPFNSATHSVGGHDRRAQASQHLDGASLPSWELEEWRYSPIEDLELERYTVVDNATPLTADELAALQVRYSTPNLVVTRNGLVIHAQGVVETDASDDAARLDTNGDLFGDMNELFAPAPLRLTVKAGAMIEDDIVIVHLIDQDGAAVFHPARCRRWRLQRSQDPRSVRVDRHRCTRCAPDRDFLWRLGQRRVRRPAAARSSSVAGRFTNQRGRPTRHLPIVDRSLRWALRPDAF